MKFRAKRDLYEEWIYGSLLRVDGSPYIVQNDDVEKDGHHLVFITDIPMLVKEETIGQFTGLYDKNGKEIYEGDILLFRTDRYTSKPIVVVFHHGAFGYFYTGDFVSFVGNTNFKFYINGSDESFGIIGNIHDNPELIKQNNNE